MLKNPLQPTHILDFLKPLITFGKPNMIRKYFIEEDESDIEDDGSDNEDDDDRNVHN